jgi:hypothetical protein
MRRLFLHIGIGKTGSSAIQHAFSTESSRLRAAGIDYPQDDHLRALVDRGAATSGNAAPVRRALRQRDVVKAESELRSLIGDSDVTLLSNEGLYTADDDALKMIRNVAGGADVKVLLFFRPQSEFFASGYLQKLKSNKPVVQDLPMDEASMRLFERGRYDWNVIASRWADMVGETNLCVGWYPAVLRDPGVVNKAFDWVGVDRPASITPVVNVSPGREAAYVIELANRANLGHRIVDRLLTAAHEKNLLGTKMTLSADTARAIDDGTRESNRTMLRRFCPELDPDVELAPTKVTDTSLDQATVQRLRDMAIEIACRFGTGQADAQRIFKA